MKKIILIMFAINVSISVSSQEFEINDIFKSNTNTAFILIDETPSMINKPKSTAKLATYLFNNFSNNNIALEVSPYWFGKFRDKNYKEYRGFNHENRIKVFNEFRKTLSFSLAVTEKKFDNFLEAKKIISFGVRTSLLNFYFERDKKVLKIIENIEKPSFTSEEKKIQDDINFHIPRIEEMNESECRVFLKEGKIPIRIDTIILQNKRKIADSYFTKDCKKKVAFYDNDEDIKPVISLDVAAGYSILSEDGNINGFAPRRYAFWSTLQIVPFNNCQNISLLLMTKNMVDGFKFNNNTYSEESYWDFGGKLNIELDKFTFSYEYIKRNDINKNFRSVGNMSYQLTDNLNVIGGFGKDFKEEGNLISFLGVNFGILRKDK